MAAEASTLSEQYLLKGKEEKTDVVSKPVEVKEEEKLVTAVSEEAVEKAEETPPLVAEEKTEDTPAAEESTEAPTTDESSSEDAPAAAEETNEGAEENSGEEAAEEKQGIKLETAPADYRFPTTNQTRHCFTRYIEYHRCVAAKGEGASECDKFAKYYRSLCPSEWVERWNEQGRMVHFRVPCRRYLFEECHAVCFLLVNRSFHQEVSTFNERCFLRECRI